MITEAYKDYPGKGWVMGTKDEPKIPKDKDIIWYSKVHHYDQTVRSDNTRFIIIKNKEKGISNKRFGMYARSDKSKRLVFHFGDMATLDTAIAFASTRKWQKSSGLKEEVLSELDKETVDVVKAATSSAMDLYFVYKFAKFIAMPWESWPAYKLGIIDDEGNVIKRKRSGIIERSNYTLFHRLLRKLKQLLERVPGMKGKLGKAVAAYFLFKEGMEKQGADGKLLDEGFIKYINDNMTLSESMQVKALMNQHILLENVKND